MTGETKRHVLILAPSGRTPCGRRGRHIAEPSCARMGVQPWVQDAGRVPAPGRKRSQMLAIPSPAQWHSLYKSRREIRAAPK